MHKDQVSICGISVFGYHGYYEQERQKGNQFEVDVHATLKLPEQSIDTLDQSFDYEYAANAIEEIFKGPSELFIEELALKIGTRLWKPKQLDKLIIKVRKLNPPVSIKVSFAEVTLCWPRTT